jgi:autoinducer 2-binding periplasmic protein LuxP
VARRRHDHNTPNREVDMSRFVSGLCAGAALLALLAGPALAQKYPLTPLPDDDDREFWWYHQVVDEDVLAAFQEVVGSPAQPVELDLDGPVRIAMIYPSQDVSDAWLRAHISMTKRFEELGIPIEVTQYASGMGDHQLQATYTDAVLQEADSFDYVVFGPTELSMQADNVKAIIDHPDLEVIVLNYDQPPQAWGDEQPLAYTGFSHLAGALIMCDYILENVGTEGSYALIRGTPGSIDDQRSGGFEQCLTERSDWTKAYEHYANFQREPAYDAANLIMTAYPEVTMIHNASTAMAMGTLSAVLAQDRNEDIFVTAWGGTGDELEALRLGELDATPMRMGDDWGTSLAEIIRADLEGRADDIPLVFLGRITIVHKDMAPEEIDAMEQEAFRYSGIGTLER